MASYSNEVHGWATEEGRLSVGAVLLLGYNYQILDTFEKIRTVPVEDWLLVPTMKPERLRELAEEIKEKLG